MPYRTCLILYDYQILIIYLSPDIYILPLTACLDFPYFRRKVIILFTYQKSDEILSCRA